MSGSLDDRNVKLVDTRAAILTLVVWPGGDIELNARAKRPDGETDHAWVAETLRRIAAVADEKAAAQ